MTNKYDENFENLLGEFIELGAEKFDYIIEEAKNKIKGRSIEDSFSVGKEYLENDDYLEAISVFVDISKRDRKVKDLADMYTSIAFSVLNSDVKHDLNVDDIIAEKMIYCMKESTDMYAKKKISKEEFSDIELLIDRIDFRNMKITEREEFNRIYEKFKEYCILDVFLGGNNED